MSIWFRCLAILTLGLSSPSLSAQQAGPAVPIFAPGQVIVAFKPGTAATERAAAHAQVGATELQTIAGTGATLVEVRAGGVLPAVAAYSRNPNVQYAEPNYYRVVYIPDEGNDPPPPTGLGIDYFAEQYGLGNTGQLFYYDEMTGQPGAVQGIADADIDAVEAWDTLTARGDPAIKVAVLDSGIDCNHVDLVSQCSEIINFGPSDTTDDVIGHGTHVAGIIGATGNNQIGIAGVSWNTTISNLKVCYEYYDWLFGPVGLCDSVAIASALDYAAANGYHIVNMSFAAPSISQTEKTAITNAWNAGVLLVAAAGNDYSQTPVYPANLPEVIAVAATDWFDNLAGFSNFGSWVSLAAPGALTFSTMPYAACGIDPSDPEGCYGWLSGTSMASPTVAGAAAALWGHLGAGISNAAIRSTLESNADQTGAAGQNMLAWTTNGRLNLNNAVLNAGGGEPTGDPGVHVADLDGTAVNQGRNWMASVSIEVQDEAGHPADGYTVSGSWSGDYTGAGICTTTAGQCSLDSDLMLKRTTSSASFTVSNVSGPAPYLSGNNADPDGDSNGTSITVIR